MRERFEKALLWLMTAVMPVFIAACYGPPMDGSGGLIYPDSETGSDIIVTGSVKDSAGTPIGGILVNCQTGSGMNVDFTYTYAGDGTFTLVVDTPGECEVLRFEDVDGEENGGDFATTAVTRDAEPMNVSLELK